MSFPPLSVMAGGAFLALRFAMEYGRRRGDLPGLGDLLDPGDLIVEGLYVAVPSGAVALVVAVGAALFTLDGSSFQGRFLEAFPPAFFVASIITSLAATALVLFVRSDRSGWFL